MKKTIIVTLGILAGFGAVVLIFRILQARGDNAMEFAYIAIFLSLMVVFVASAAKR